MGQIFVLPACLVYILNTKCKNKSPVDSFDFLTTGILYQPSKINVMLCNKTNTEQPWLTTQALSLTYVTCQLWFGYNPVQPDFSQEPCSTLE